VDEPVGDRPAERVARPRLLAGADDVDVAVERDTPPAARDDRLGPDQLCPWRLLAGMARMGPERAQVVLDELRLQAEPPCDRDERLRGAALVAGQAGNLYERGDVRRQGGRVEPCESFFDGSHG
jgi:hypothetical protein